MSKSRERHGRPGPFADREFPLIGGYLCLDFANTCSGRGHSGKIDRLSQLDDIRKWAIQANILQQDEILNEPRAQPGKGQLLSSLIEIRETIHAIALARARGKAPRTCDLTRIQTAYAFAINRANLLPSNGAWSWSWSGSREMMARIAGPVLQSTINFLSISENSRVKQCPASDCGFVFYDQSKNKSRLWCEMQVCGNRSKSRSFYYRRVAETD